MKPATKSILTLSNLGDVYNLISPRHMGGESFKNRLLDPRTLQKTWNSQLLSFMSGTKMKHNNHLKVNKKNLHLYSHIVWGSLGVCTVLRMWLDGALQEGMPTIPPVEKRSKSPSYLQREPLSSWPPLEATARAPKVVQGFFCRLPFQYLQRVETRHCPNR